MSEGHVPNIEFRATWKTDQDPVEVTILPSKEVLLRWAAQKARWRDGFEITKLEDRIVPAWETVPDDSWPEGMTR